MQSCQACIARASTTHACAHINPHTLASCCCGQAPHISLALAGVEVISNGSGSHHQLRKLDTRMDLIRSATAKVGGQAAAKAAHACMHCTQAAC